MQSIQEIVIKEIKRQQNRQIARTLDDLVDLKLPKLVEERIKQGFYDFADNLIKLIQDTQNDKSNNKQKNDKSNNKQKLYDFADNLKKLIQDTQMTNQTTKKGLYDFADTLKKLIQDTQNDKSNKQLFNRPHKTSQKTKQLGMDNVYQAKEKEKHE